MIFRIDEFKNVCSTILSAIDSSVGTVINETLELKVEDNSFIMAVTNREYYVKYKIEIPSVDEDFHATVNANIFLKLISKITTDTVELKTEGNSLIINGNGSYKLPMIFDGVNLLELPVIDILNPTINFPMDGNILLNISKYNLKQTRNAVKTLQFKCYVDEQGAYTFTSGACVTKFSLVQPVRMLLNQKLMKLLSLFKNKQVNFTMGYDAASDSIIQTKVKFDDGTISISAIISNNDAELDSFPVNTIRKLAYNPYPYSVVLNREELVQIIDRLMLFPSAYNKKLWSKFVFSKDSVTIYDSADVNKESMYYSNNSSIEDEYEACIDFRDIKSVLESFTDQYITFNFGGSVASVICVGDVYFVIPEINEDENNEEKYSE